MVTEILTEQIKEQLKHAIKDRFGKPLNSVKSFEELAVSTRLSVQTLRRFFGKIDLDKNVGFTSLSLLCKYVGFEDWQAFSSYIIQLDSVSNKDKNYIESMSAFFENGEGKISHVGVMLDNQKIIHAYGKVRIDTLDSSGIFNQELKRHTHKLRFVKSFL